MHRQEQSFLFKSKKLITFEAKGQEISKDFMLPSNTTKNYFFLQISALASKSGLVQKIKRLIREHLVQ